MVTKRLQKRIHTTKFTYGEDVIFFPKGNSSGGKMEIDNGKRAEI